MEKIKPVLQWLVRNRFWVTCVLVSIASLVTWYLAWSSIEKTRTDRTRVLNQKKSSIDNVLGSGVATGVGDDELKVHPNSGTASGMDKRIEEAGNSALAAWKVRYEKQKALLNISEVLPPHIRTGLVAHEPMEKPLENGELMPPNQRETFADYITLQMPKIAEKIQMEWQFDKEGIQIEDKPADDGSRKNNKRDAGLRVSNDLVRWDFTNQELWNSKSSEFLGFNGNTSAAPTSQQMLALQQDLWILEGIFDAIAEVNKGFTANDLAPIERIDHVLVGQEAINPGLGALGPVSYSPDAGASTGGGSSAKKGTGGVKTKKQIRKERRKESKRGPSKKSKKKSKTAATFKPTDSKSPFHGRYVDRDFTQLNESAITTAITSDKLTDQSYLAVAKRVPVRIAVKMDERRINEFLASAANSPFAFEIRQIRINKHEPGEGVERKADASAGKKTDDKNNRGSVGIGGGTGSGGSQADDNSGAGSRGRGGPGSAIDGPFVPELRTNFDVKVEFIGIVKIYNPVNRSLIFPNEKKDSDQD